jgi:hypothetical protein
MMSGTGRGQEREARDYEGGTTDEVKEPPVPRRLAPLPALAVAVVAGLETMAGLELPEHPPALPALHRLLDHVQFAPYPVSKPGQR